MSSITIAELNKYFKEISLNKNTICILGSMNADYTVTTEFLPKPGETVSGSPMKILPGGKSGNQAAAAAKLGAKVKMFGCVGNDSNGKFLLSNLQKARVNVSEVSAVNENTGTTIITVDSAGENTIVYSAGANKSLTKEYVHSVINKMAFCNVVGLCLESPLNAVTEAAILCHEVGITVLLNASPYMNDIPNKLIAACDVLLVNEVELSQLIHLPEKEITPTADWSRVAKCVMEQGFSKTLVTLGSHGSMVIDEGKIYHVEAIEVKAVDTTGCGDSYMGAVLAGLNAGISLYDSAKLAGIVSAYAARSTGAQASYGTANNIANWYAMP